MGMQRISRPGRTVLGWGVVAGASIFALTGIAAHAIERDHDLVRSSLSSYAVSPFGWVMEVGFFALAATHLVLLLTLARRPFARQTLVGVALVGLNIEALTVLTVALYPANGLGYVNGISIHGTAATIAFVVFPPTAILLAQFFRTDPVLSSVASSAFIIALVNTLALALLGLAAFTDAPWVYLAEKADALVTAIWLIIVGSALTVSPKAV